MKVRWRPPARPMPKPTAAQLGPDWIWPHWLERQLDPRSPAFVPAVMPAFNNSTLRNWTAVGTFASGCKGLVDPRGLLTPRHHGWSIDWWVLSEERWHFPSRESAVRQQLLDETPVVETSMRIPGGDAVQRVFAAAAPEPVAVIEISNRTPTPIAVALSVRPYNPEGLAAVRRIALRDCAVTVDGVTALRLPRRPSGVAASTLRDGDVASRVVAEDTAGGFPPNLHCGAGLATAAFVFPLAHSATLRFAVPLDVEKCTMRSLPTSEEVARGWKAHTSKSGVRLVLPPGRLASAVEANRNYLLLFQEGAGARPRRLLRRKRVDVRRKRIDGDAVNTQLTLELAERELDTGDPRCLERLAWMLDAATQTYTWPEWIDARLGGGCRGVGHHWPTAAQFLNLVGHLLVREAAPRELALCSIVPEQWRGRNIEVHDAPTGFGMLSFAVRWHGDRPALLWDLKVADHSGEVRLKAPGLDVSWWSDEPRGEALLSPATEGSVL